MTRFREDVETLSEDRTRHQWCRDGAPLTYQEVLDLWASDDEFTESYIGGLCSSEFTAFRWETPALTEVSLQQPFEHVLLNAPAFARRATDSRTFAPQLAKHGADVAAFNNLSGDAVLVVPAALSADDNYGHLAAFLRNAPAGQVRLLWKVVADTMRNLLETPPQGTTRQPIWLSTAGGGVAWLHVRFDSRPKYYGHQPYRSA